MSTSMWARPLAPSELELFHKTEVGKKAVKLGSMAVMGREDLYYVKNLNEEVISVTECIGDNSFDTKYIGGGAASGGEKVSIVFDGEISLCYVVNAAIGLNIPVISNTSQPNIIYFQVQHIGAFLQAFSYASHALKNWYENRSTLSIWLDGMYPDISSNASKDITSGVRRILTKNE